MDTGSRETQAYAQVNIEMEENNCFPSFGPTNPLFGVPNNVQIGHSRFDHQYVCTFLHITVLHRNKVATVAIATESTHVLSLNNNSTHTGQVLTEKVNYDTHDLTDNLLFTHSVG